MGTSYTSALIVGIRLDKLFKFEKRTIDQYELHDERTGKPTGKMSDGKPALAVKYGNKETVLEYENKMFYMENLEEIPGLKYEPNDGEIGLRHIKYNYSDDFNPEFYVFGFSLGSYGEYDKNIDGFDMSLVAQKIDEVARYVVENFGIDNVPVQIFVARLVG